MHETGQAGGRGRRRGHDRVAPSGRDAPPTLSATRGAAAQGGRAGGLQGSRGWLEGSFEARSRGHPGM